VKSDVTDLRDRKGAVVTGSDRKGAVVTGSDRKGGVVTGSDRKVYAGTHRRCETAAIFNKHAPRKKSSIKSARTEPQ
jgi:hypothetical protein